MKEVSAGGVVYYQENDEIKVLMIEDIYHKWTLPKGKREEGETYKQTAIREILEETGIKGEVVKPLDKVYYEYYHSSFDKVEKEVHYYLVKALSNQIKVQTSEISSARWLSLEDAWEKQKTSGYENNLFVLKKALQELGFNKF
ncbi:NTP pyrophosphohydrolase [Vulcanibacillus modesticaldus]|uniref:NTP pyrophosphohydrolase n=1 Tax=Vulcanibacillus modesticaldus TaxID=337097 RepID=A0A1D2YSB5_9BACI|nr:NUDIX domain-containing protein [Vulcanibacillus modesticaldus]OEF96945.1 NTP pyrophosphohydrolase [Vulcanibacillus modesticaldus]